VPCRIRVFSGQKHERSQLENPPNGDFGWFLHGNLSPCQAKIRQMVAENTTHGMSRTFVWWGEKSPCENTKKSPFGGFSRGVLSPRKHTYTTWHKSATILKSYLQAVIIFGLRFAFFTHISGKKRTVSKYVR